jgi:hypothetical protein
VKDFADGGADCIEGSCGSLSEQMFGLGEDLFDQIQVETS